MCVSNQIKINVKYLRTLHYLFGRKNKTTKATKN